MRTRIVYSFAAACTAVSSARAAAAADKMHLEYLQNCVGRIFNVLYEQPRDGLFQGHAENYMTVAARGEDLHNLICPTKILEARDGLLIGEIID